MFFVRLFSTRLIWRFLLPALSLSLLAGLALTALAGFIQANRSQDQTGLHIGQKLAILEPLLLAAEESGDTQTLTRLLHSFSAIPGIACVDYRAGQAVLTSWPVSGCSRAGHIIQSLSLALGPPAGNRQLLIGINTRYEREGLLLQMLGFAGLILAALIVIGLIFILFFRRLVERPLLTLAEAFQQSEPGAPAQAVIDRQDEIGQLAVSYNDMARKVRQTHSQIREQEADLQRINRNFGDSVIYASLIQRRLLPARRDLTRHLGENALLWQPKDTVGGDLLWVGSQGGADFLFFFDCTGHGVPGAMMTTITIGVIDRLMADAALAASPSGLMQALHGGICSALRIAPDQPGREGLDCAIIRLDRDAGTLQFCGAAIDLLELQAGKPVQRWRGARRALGYQNETSFGHLSVITRPLTERSFVLMSDGLVSQVGSRTGRVMGTRRMLARLNEAADTSPAGLVRVLARSLKEWQGEEERRDDVMVLAFRPLGRR